MEGEISVFLPKITGVALHDWPWSELWSSPESAEDEVHDECMRPPGSTADERSALWVRLAAAKSFQRARREKDLKMRKARRRPKECLCLLQKVGLRLTFPFGRHGHLHPNTLIILVRQQRCS